MKNIEKVDSNCGFLCKTPNGADTVTCPVCGQTEFFFHYGSEEYDKCFEKYNYIYENEKIMGHPDLEYCVHCNIMYSIGHLHVLVGCTDDIYVGHLVSKWSYQDMVHNGMPLFDNVEEYLDKVQDIKILEMSCPHGKCKVPT